MNNLPPLTSFALFEYSSSMPQLGGVWSAVLGCVIVAAGCQSAPQVEPEPIAPDIVLPDPVMLFIRISPAKYGFNRADFFLLDTEVTNNMYARFLAATRTKKGDEEILLMYNEEQRKLKSGGFIVGGDVRSFSVSNPELFWSANTPPPNSGNLPVVLVNVEQAAAFCDWLTQHYGDMGRFRLPTKTEWLIAAYGSGRSYPWGNDPDDSRYHHAPPPPTTYPSTQPLPRPEPVRARLDGRTPEGLFGMWGNVNEIAFLSIHKEGLPYRGVTTYSMGGGFNNQKFSPAQNDWGHSSGDRRADDVGFRVLLDPTQRVPATQPATKPSER